ncbi:bactofilin family protein [Novispirillum itersonii]|uniref:bactofilin family protein n=1 Tax=Novispirillum itersonii TaxID=189 RepID=UPI00035F3786|nr:polymer-forming cytoskeletal protein [Novispirillum itersonii]
MSVAAYPLSPFGSAGTSYLAPDLTIRGRIETSGSVEMDCEFHGDVLARQATVGPNGRIRARISAEEATVSGNMTGIVNARQAIFRDGCHFRGEVEYESLGTEPCADVNARLVPVMSGTSRPAIPTVTEIPAAASLKQAAAASVSPPRFNMSMLAFLGGMIVAGVITGITVINPTTRNWKDQLLEQVTQSRTENPATVAETSTTATAAPAAVAASSTNNTTTEAAPRITPPPPPAVPPSLSKIMPSTLTAAEPPSVPAIPAAETVETKPAVTAQTPVAVAPTPVVTAPPPVVIPDLSPSPPLPRHEPVDRPIPAAVSPEPAPVAAPAVPAVAAAATAQTPPAPAEAASSSQPATGKPTPASREAVTDDPAPTKDTGTVKATVAQSRPADSPAASASAKKTKPALPAGARGALQEVCTWELKCEAENQCISVRSCKMQ